MNRKPLSQNYGLAERSVLMKYVNYYIFKPRVLVTVEHSDIIYSVASMAILVGKCVIFLQFSFSFFFLFSVSAKFFPDTSLLSDVFVRRVFFVYFVRFEGAVVMRIFFWCTQENI